MDKSIKILVVEDEVEDYELIRLELKKANLQFQSKRVASKDELYNECNSLEYDLILCDNKLPAMDATSALKIVREVNQEIPFIIVSGTIGEENAVKLMRLGANDYVNKANQNRLIAVLKREIKEYEVKKSQKEYRKNLVLSELRYKNLMESISDIFFAIDDKLHLLFWNTATEREFQKKVELNAHLLSLFPEWAEEELLITIQKTIDTGQKQTFNLRSQIKNKIEYFEGTATSSNFGATVLIRKVTEKYLNQKNLEKLNNELEVLLYRIGHDLKGPVSSVEGLLNIMQMTSDYDKEKFINMMSVRVGHLKKTLKVLRDVANIKYGKYIQYEIHVNQAIQEIIDSISSNYNTSLVSINTLIDKKLKIKGDILLFKSIIQNLIENAIKYGADVNGRVTIELEIRESGNDILIKILDSGKGIPEPLQDKIFDMFYRGDERSDGSGLGLYIVKQAVEKLHGKIAVTTEVNKGTLFTILIPHSEQLQLNTQ
ncbi:hybrid sensor histidine kinase/response regulator [Fulvivirga lutea]|uniref:histidine kinase n=1 Tax=Fulvivirga lutea TaxID=2810512 RepID=A0A974WHT5_9BACT|nr:hybrid sensor histidine kinase/response regulator [Fulvivirga lutea]QSE98819.1 hybrid sensor histidine kinase/response regulator [Fulvivirga lutea]